MEPMYHSQTRAEGRFELPSRISFHVGGEPSEVGGDTTRLQRVHPEQIRQSPASSAGATIVFFISEYPPGPNGVPPPARAAHVSAQIAHGVFKQDRAGHFVFAPGPARGVGGVVECFGVGHEAEHVSRGVGQSGDGPGRGFFPPTGAGDLSEWQQTRGDGLG